MQRESYEWYVSSMAIDPEATGILIANGLDVPTAVAGSIIDEPKSPIDPKERGAREIGALIGVGIRLA